MKGIPGLASNTSAPVCQWWVSQIASKNLPKGGGDILMEDTPTTTAEVTLPTEGRRVYTLAYKRHILARIDACSHLGEKSALLRREGLYASYVTKWRQQLARHDKKTPSSNTPTNKGGRPRLSQAERENRALRKENERLKKQLERAELAVDVQKKLLRLLDLSSPTNSTDSSNSGPQSSS